MSKNEEIKLNARVSEIHRDRYTLIDEEKNEIFARLKGSLYKQLDTYPVVGDYVSVKFNLYGDSIIEEIKPRRTYFMRPDLSGHAPGYVKTIKDQMLAANYDYAFIIVSLNQDYSLNRIMRYVSLTLQGGGKPIVILTKADLCKDTLPYISEIKETAREVEVFAVSSKLGIGLSQLTPYLDKNKTIILLGSSGVGKSTLINKLADREIMEVSEIREKDGKGRHTTTHRQMIQMPSGAIMIDTPGMREIGILDAEEGINDTFSDITKLINLCKFSDCRHDKEPGCAIRGAIEEGALSEERYSLYRSFQSENKWSTEKAKQFSKRYGMNRP